MSGKIQTNSKLIITAFPRIHMTLIGMNSSGYRINGGIGFSISEPKLIITLKASNLFMIKDLRIGCFTYSEIDRLKSKVDEIKVQFGFKYNISCEISGQSFTHFGFGTSTATYLACIEGLFILNNYPYDSELIKKISGRGGTSGIGLNTYFSGGFVFDVGISVKDGNESIAPSSISDNRSKLPLVLNQVEAPEWKVGLVIPKNIKNKSEEEEIDFFKKACPIESDKVSAILYNSVYGALSAIYEKDFNVFCESVKAIQRTEWKKEERNLYGNAINNIEADIYRLGAKCVGMSSLGPGLYFLNENIDIGNSSDEYNILEAEFNNNSRLLEYD